MHQFFMASETLKGFLWKEINCRFQRSAFISELMSNLKAEKICLQQKWNQTKVLINISEGVFHWDCHSLTFQLTLKSHFLKASGAYGIAIFIFFPQLQALRKVTIWCIKERQMLSRNETESSELQRRKLLLIRGQFAISNYESINETMKPTDWRRFYCLQDLNLMTKDFSSF